MTSAGPGKPPTSIFIENTTVNSVTFIQKLFSKRIVDQATKNCFAFSNKNYNDNR